MSARVTTSCSLTTWRLTLNDYTDLLTVAQAAARLGIAPATVRQQIIAGRIAARKLSPKVLLVERSEVERYAASDRRPGRKAKL